LAADMSEIGGAAPASTPTASTNPNAVSSSSVSLTAGQVGFGSAGGTLTSSSNLTYTAGGALGITVTGNPLATTPWLTLNFTNTAATSEGYLEFKEGGTQFARLNARRAGTHAAPTSYSVRVAFTVSATRSTFDVHNDTANTTPFLVDSGNSDVFAGSEVALAQAAVNGFVYIPVIATAPSGVPARTGFSAWAGPAIAYDATNFRLYAYDFTGNAWRYTTWDNYAPTSTRIPFGSATAATMTDSSTFTWTNSTAVLAAGIATASANTAIHAKQSVNGGANLYVQNASAGGAAYVGLTLGSNDTIFTNAYGGLFFYGTGFTTAAPLAAGALQLVVSGGSANMVLDVAQATGDMIFRTGGGPPTERFRLTNAGVLQFAATGAIKLNTGTTAANGSVATAMTSLGPTGSHTTIQEWLLVTRSGGASGWIPIF
jgi:hypothetical protein